MNNHKQLTFDIGQSNTVDRYNIILQYLIDNNIEYIIDYNKIYQTNNIILPATNLLDKKVVIMAHYDVIDGNRSFGYLDNASAVAMILLMYNNFADNVEVVFTDIEEYGQLGCNDYCSKYKDQIDFIINVDVIGFGNNLFYNSNDNKINSIIKQNFNKVLYNADFPLCDYNTIKMLNIPSISLSTAQGNSFSDQMYKIMSLIHEGVDDNKLNKINNNIIIKTQDTILKLIDVITKERANYGT